jgi:hypothetical protein
MPAAAARLPARSQPTPSRTSPPQTPPARRRQPSTAAQRCAATPCIDGSMRTCTTLALLCDVLSPAHKRSAARDAPMRHQATRKRRRGWRCEERRAGGGLAVRSLACAGTCFVMTHGAGGQECKAALRAGATPCPQADIPFVAGTCALCIYTGGVCCCSAGGTTGAACCSSLRQPPRVATPHRVRRAATTSVRIVRVSCLYGMARMSPAANGACIW